MLTLSGLVWATFFAALISFWWQSDRIKTLALNFVVRYCKEHKLQLLDQTMVLRAVWPARDTSGTLRLKRKYSFEFTSTGEQRYRGEAVLLGYNLLKLEMDAHIIPDEPPP